MTEPSTQRLRLKREIRSLAHANRRSQPDKDRLSRLICERFAALPEYASARAVMLYVHVRSEVRTRHFLPAAIDRKDRIVVPYCTRGELGLFRLESMEELAEGTFGLLEPRAELRGLPEKRVEAAELDLIMVPGVAFDRRGGRLGHGKGYYDKLLARVRPDVPLIAAAFECQLFDEIPMEPHDVFMDRVITEKEIYPGRGRPA